MVIVLLGVSGSGKSTIGTMLARELSFEFYEGDDYHSQANREKMRAGVPLTDADRQPRLAAIRALIDAILARNGNAVVTCSALKHSYRDYLGGPGVRFVYLKGAPQLIRERLRQRKGHFFDPALLESQFATLEEPRDAIVADVAKPPANVVSDIVERMSRAG